MTALSNFSLSVEDSKVNNAVLQTEISAIRKFPFASTVYLSWYWIWDPWGLCYSQIQLQGDAQQTALSCYAASRKQQKLSQNDAVPKASFPFAQT